MVSGITHKYIQDNEARNAHEFSGKAGKAKLRTGKIWTKGKGKNTEGRESGSTGLKLKPTEEDS